MTTEQIELQGFVKIDFKNGSNNRTLFKKGNYFLIVDLNYEIPHLEIFIVDPSKYMKSNYPEKFYFMADCNTISKFKTICKILKIK
jgi:hypothetical protein